MRLALIVRAGLFAVLLALFAIPGTLYANGDFEIRVRDPKLGSMPNEFVIESNGYPPGTICEATVRYYTRGRTPSDVVQFAVFLNDSDTPSPNSYRSANRPFFRDEVVQVGTAKSGRNTVTIAALNADGDILHSTQASFICIEIVIETLACDFDHNITLDYRISTASRVNLRTVEVEVDWQDTHSARRINRPFYAHTINTNAGRPGQKYVLIRVRATQDSNALLEEVDCPRGPMPTLDTATTPFNAPITLDVLANDYANDAGSLILYRLDPVSDNNGTVTFNPGEQTVTYTPADGFSGVDEFNYGIRGTLGGEANGGTVRITVASPRVEPTPAPPPRTTPIPPPPTLAPPPSPPSVDCPAGTEQFAYFGETVVMAGQSPTWTFTLPDTVDGAGVMVIVNMVGHPEVGCPTSGDPLCDQLQDNEAFDVVLNGTTLGRVGDQGGHGWHRSEFPADIGADEHTVQFAHVGRDANDSPGSTTVEAAYCAPTQ